MQADRSGQDREIVEARPPLSHAPMRPAADLTSEITLRRPQRLTAPAPQPGGSGLGLIRVRTAVAAAAEGEAGRGIPFLFVPVAMGAGAGLFYSAPRDPALIPLVAALALALMVTLAAHARHLALARAAGFAAAILTGGVAAAIEQHAGTVLLDQDVTTSIAGIVEAREFDAAGRVRYLVRLSATADPELGRPPGRVRLVARAPHTPLPVGAAIAGRARLSAPSGPAMPGGYDFAFRAFIDGIGAHGFFYRAPEPGGPLATPPDRWEGFRLGLRTVREGISERIRSVLPGDPGGIAAALAVNDRRGISEAAVDALRATGLAHILAISGLHMALAAGTLYILVRKLLAAAPSVVEAWPVKKIAAIGALMAATAYLMISGGSVSTQRAWVMLAIMLVAVLADRPALTMRNVALAAILIILVTPSAVVGPGFQMSFAATAALISAYAVIAARKRPVRGAPGWLAGSAPGRAATLFTKAVLGLAITSLVAGLATGLFSAHHFHRLAGNGVLANVLAMPLVTFVVMPAGVMALLSMPFGLDEWPLKLMGKGLEGVIWAARYVQGLGGDIVVGQIPLAATVMAGSGFILLVFLRSRLRLAGVALIGLGAVLALPPLRDPGPAILVSEDGGLVALAGPTGLASNAARPGEFLFRQWQTALRDTPHIPPVTVKPVPVLAAAYGLEESRPARSPAQGSFVDGSRADGAEAAVDPEILDRLLAAAAAEASRFHCVSRGVCAALHNRARIIAIDTAALIGAACDRADLVVVAIPVHMRSCRSGAILVTARSLRTTGALAIRMGQGRFSSAGDDGSLPSGQDRLVPPARDQRLAARPHFDIDAALKGVIRPWTIQRYYDWRSRSYDLPD
ncbi:MAG: ComEC/Rec2 family competence protein [Hoeflea sp.]|nr:ComEC/Rec2 family competence protein [Hoeflea sp.]